MTNILQNPVEEVEISDGKVFTDYNDIDEPVIERKLTCNSLSIKSNHSL